MTAPSSISHEEREVEERLPTLFTRSAQVRWKHRLGRLSISARIRCVLPQPEGPQSNKPVKERRHLREVHTKKNREVIRATTGSGVYTSVLKKSLQTLCIEVLINHISSKMKSRRKCFSYY
eukprot:scaffold633_cov288-Ochromonas_danica.AAC.80